MKRTGSMVQVGYYLYFCGIYNIFREMREIRNRPGRFIAMLSLSALMMFNTCRKVKDPFDYIQLIGKWEMVSENCKEIIDGELIYDETVLYEAGQTFLEFKSDGNGATYEKESLVSTFQWSRAGNTININTDDSGMFSSFSIQALDQDMLSYRVNIEEDLDPELEYISFCDYSLSRVEDGS
jgi:hypothetical protein